MSTKCSIKYGENFHLYHECFDDENVYLEIELDEYAEVSGKSVSIKIRPEIWEVIRQHSQLERFNWAGKTDEEVHREVVADVEERISTYNNSKDKTKNLSRFFGCIPYGDAADPKEDQIMRGLEYFLEKRDRQDAIVKKFKDLESKQR